jgi:hypothetical protein
MPHADGLAVGAEYVKSGFEARFTTSAILGMLASDGDSIFSKEIYK